MANSAVTKNGSFHSGFPMGAQAKTKQQFQISNGQLINPIATPKRAAVVAGLSTMVGQGMIPVDSPHGSTNLLAEKFLSTQTCLVSGERKNFSLLSNQTDSEIIDNPHIFK